MDLSSPGSEKQQKNEETNGLVNDRNASSLSSSSQSRSNSSSPSLISSSSESSWYQLQLGAKPVKIRRKEWMCSQDCKKKNKTAIYKDSQAVEKHILRNHPDPIYNEFVCLFAWCKMARTSPQQVLDHLGQSEKYDGHELKDQKLKYESIRAVHIESKERHRVRRDKKEFAWYVCVPQEEGRSLCPGGSATNNNKTNNQFPANQVISSTREQIGSQKIPSHVQEDFPHAQKHGRPPDVLDAHVNSRHLDPGKMLTGGFSAVPG